MKVRSQNNANLFLLEVIISIAFFAMASVVCVQFFAQARLKANDQARESRILLAEKSFYASLQAEGTDVYKIYDPAGDEGETEFSFELEGFAVSVSLNMGDDNMLTADMTIREDEEASDVLAEKTFTVHEAYIAGEDDNNANGSNVSQAADKENDASAEAADAKQGGDGQ